MNRFRIFTSVCVDALAEISKCCVTIENGRIVSLEAIANSGSPQPGDIDGGRSVLMPGFVDIHIHGGAGKYVMDGGEESILEIASHLASHGITGFLPTTVTAPRDEIRSTVEASAQLFHSPDNGKSGAAVLGTHLEGPFINPKKKGAQPEEYIIPPSVDELMAQVGSHLDTIKVMTIAPEIPGALDVIKFLCANDIIASIGHSNASYDEMCLGINAGARHVTHCFNAMRPMEGREPGVVGATLMHKELSAELIWDNIHVHPASCAALINAKGVDGVIFISDGIQAAGMEEGFKFSIGGTQIISKNGAARLADGTLAGSLLTLDRAVANAHILSLKDRAKMSSFNALRALGLSHRKGLIRPGYDADLVLLGANGTVKRTFIGGREIYSADSLVD